MSKIKDESSFGTTEEKNPYNTKFKFQLKQTIYKKVGCLPVWSILLIVGVTLLVIAAIITTIVIVLVVTLPKQPQRPDPPVWLTRRSVVSATTNEQVSKSTRTRRSADGESASDSNTTSNPGWASTAPTTYGNWSEYQNVSAPVITTTSIVLSSSPTEVQILIVHGNVSVVMGNETFTSKPPTGSRRRKRDTSNSNNVNGTSLNDVPMLLVTADPYTGNITSLKGTSNCTDSFKNVGLVVARSMLTNQDPNAYDPSASGGSRKRRAAVLNDCVHLEDIDGNAYCPQFTLQKTATRTVYKKTYSTGNALLKDASTDNQNVDMNVQIETHVADDNQTLVKSQVNGSATLNAITNENGTQQITLQKSLNTYFSVDSSSLNDVAIDRLHSMVSDIDFQEVSQKSSANNSLTNYTVGNFTSLINSTFFNTSMALTRKRRNSDSQAAVTIVKLFGANVDFAVHLVVTGNSATVTVGLAVGPFYFPLPPKDLGSGVATAINQLLNLRSIVKNLLDNTKNVITAFVGSVNLDFVKTINSHVAIIKTDVANLKAAFLRPVTTIATEVQNYKNKVLAIRDAIIANFTSMIQTANNQISQIKQQAQNVISIKNMSIAQQIAPFKQSFDNAVAEISLITNNINTITTFFSSQNPILQGLIQAFNNVTSGLKSVYTKAQSDIQTFITNEQSSASRTLQSIQNATKLAIQSLQDEAAGDIMKYKTYLTQKAADFADLLNSTNIRIASITSEIASLQSQLRLNATAAIQLANLTQILTYYQQTKTQLTSIQNALSTHLNAVIIKRQTELSQLISNTQTAVNAKMTAYGVYANQSTQYFQQAAQGTLQLLATYLSGAIGINQNSTVRLGDVKNAILSMVSSAVHSALNLADNIENDFLNLSGNLLTRLKSILPGLKADTQSILAKINSNAQNVSSNLLSFANTEVANYKQIKQLVLTELQTFSSNMDGLITNVGVQMTGLSESLMELDESALESFYHEETELLALIESDYENFISDIQETVTQFANVTESGAQNFVATLQSNFGSLTSQLQVELLATQSLFLTTFNASVQNSITQFDSFKSSIKDLVMRFERYANLTVLQTMWQGLKTDAVNSISNLQNTLNSFISQKQNETQVLVSTVQNSINVLNAKLTSIAQNTYSFALDLRNASLTSIDIIFASFSQAENEIPLILQNITKEGQLIWNDLNTGLQNFKSGVTTASGQIYNSFNNIAGQSTATNSDSGNIFDWAFVGDDINSIQTSFNTITTGINSARDLLSGQIQSLLTDIQSVINPSKWTQAYQDAIGQVAQLQSTLHYQADPPKRTQSSVQSSASSISSNSQQNTSKVSVSDIAASGSSANLQATISKLINANSLRDGLINAFLSKLVIPVYNIMLFDKVYSFILAEVPTPIGLIGVGVYMEFNANFKIGIILSPSKFAAVVTPGANLNIGAEAFWSIVLIKVAAAVGVQASVSIPVELGMSKEQHGLYVSASLNYGLAGFAGMYAQYWIPTIYWICYPIRIWYPCGFSCDSGGCSTIWCEYDIWVCYPIIIFVWSPPNWFLYTSFGGSSKSTLLFTKSLK